MRRHWLLVLLVASIQPAFARSPHVEPVPPVAAMVEQGSHAGTLVLTFHNDRDEALTLPIRVRADTIQYDWLTVTLSNATTTRALTFVRDRDKSTVESVTIPPYESHVERIDLDPLTADLPRGEYNVVIRWDQPTLDALIQTTVFLPPHYRCGLSMMAPAPPAPAPHSPASKWPYVLGGLATLLVAFGLSKRAGTADGRVPCSLP